MSKSKKSEKERRSFKREFKKSFSTAIIAAFSLLAAISWSDVIKDWLENIERVSLLQGKIIIAILVTFLAALAVYIASKLNDK